MGRTLIIPNADFESVAEYQIDLPRELDARTELWATASGNALTESQKLALDNLVLALDLDSTTGIGSKIDKLYLPMLALDKAHALVDYKLGTPAATDMSGDATWCGDGTDADAYVAFGNHGLYSLETSTSRAAPVVDSSYTFDTQNVSMFVLNTVAYPSVTSSTARGAMGYSGSGTKTFYLQQGPDYMLYKPLNVETSRDSSANFKNAGLKGFIGNSSNLIAVDESGNFPTASAATQETLTGLAILTGVNKFLIKNDTTPIGAIIVGKAMTTAEATILKQKVDALFAAMNV